jgi:hypothetical protein
VPEALKVCDNSYGAIGVTLALADEDAPDTPAADAVTVKVYAVPLLNPVTVKGLDAPEAVKPPGELVTV